ncbi:hypothetical protein EYZ11_012519 [Aspergillus tanneri]|uniref:Uncharacterized protein n=1 Tax=Aspergillus tanneri TaxID=1220188 RepID=A0A4S3J0B5_9EURO|nr:hypothetical protein EYZ11_012519 [Aspergillus tanneri]
MAQMLVVERAVQMADNGDVAHPADALDAMRERFLLHGVRAPFGWITRLRTYGKKVQNTTTSQGYIYWSDDEQTLSYKELRLTITGFRQFIRTQVALAQASLEELFLIHEEEARDAIIPYLPLADLQDDPTNNQRGWNFLRSCCTGRAPPFSRPPVGPSVPSVPSAPSLPHLRRVSYRVLRIARVTFTLRVLRVSDIFIA